MRVSSDKKPVLAVGELEEVFTDVRKVVRVKTKFVNDLLYLLANCNLNLLLSLSIFIQS
jgi:hypothetical protein